MDTYLNQSHSNVLTVHEKKDFFLPASRAIIIFIFHSKRQALLAFFSLASISIARELVMARIKDCDK